MREDVRAIPIVLWPGQHQKLHQRAIGPLSIANRTGLAAHWQAATQRGVWQRWGLWLEFCRRQGVDIDATDPAGTMIPAVFAAYIAELQVELRSVTVATYVRDMSEALRVMQPAASRQMIKDALSELAAAAEPAIDVVPEKIGPSDLYDAGIMQAEENQTAADQCPAAALAFGDGVLIAVWSCAGVRARTMALTQRRHLCRVGDYFELRYAAHEIKTKLPIDVPLPPELTPVLEHWMHLADTVLGCTVDSGCDGDKPLWPTHQGRQMSQRQQFTRLCMSTARNKWLKQRIHPQQIRRIIATSIAIDQPGRIELAKVGLGHSKLRTTRKHYIKTSNLPGARRCTAAVSRLRYETRSLLTPEAMAKIASMIPKKRIGRTI